ncbi:UDP-2,3-diacylglucosamine diphosphatase LpxI [bacterium]|nr:UDP-2,3-diacylglucosamine diphosphatase LpxI [bacterium]
MSLLLEQKQALIAGDGQLPVIMAENAAKNGLEVICISLSNDNYKALKRVCSKVYSAAPGEVLKIKKILQDEEVKQLTFLGKVHKGLILKRPKFDSRALELIKSAKKLNDDQVMLLIVQELENIGVTVIDQTLFIKNLMIPAGILGSHKPTDEQINDVQYGYTMAKEMGKLDVGQSVVIKDKMIMAVEAIEGTDKCIERGGKIAKKGGVVVKVAKPSQDKRFDIPAVGLRTLKTMKKFKLSVLAVEANETIIVDQEKVVQFANRNNIIIMAV